MLIDLLTSVGSYLHDVFIAKFDWWMLLGFVGAGRCSPCASWCSGSPPSARGKSVMPVAFWFFSIGGGVLLFVYALYQRDPVFILGQGFGVFVYVRNLYFELRDRRRAMQAA